jgi:hypothetical protein
MALTLRVLLPSAGLGGDDFVLSGDLLDALLALERLGGDAGFEFDGQVSSFSFQNTSPTC